MSERREVFREIGDLASYVVWGVISVFLLSRLVVWAILDGWLPTQMFLHIYGQHIHHYVYGIFLIVAVCAFLLFSKTIRKTRHWFAFTFGVGLALLFDEFSFWATSSKAYHDMVNFWAVGIIVVAAGLISQLYRFIK